MEYTWMDARGAHCPRLPDWREMGNRAVLAALLQDIAGVPFDSEVLSHEFHYRVSDS